MIKFLICCMLEIGAALVTVPALPAQAAPQVRSIGGVVVDANGAPVTDALICWVVGKESWDRSIVPLETKTGGDGSFLLRLPSPAVRETEEIDDVWVYAPGHALARLKGSECSIGADGQARKKIVLGAAAPLTYRVVDPDGRPRQGELVEPRSLYLVTRFAPFPDVLKERLGGITDENGELTLNAYPPSTFVVPCVVSEVYGFQRVVKVEGNRPRSLMVLLLRRVGRVEGRIITDRPEAFAGLRLTAQTEDADADEMIRLGGCATVVVGRDGRFSIPALGEGTLQLSAASLPPVDVVPRLTGRAVVEAGKTLTVEIPTETSPPSPSK